MRAPAEPSPEPLLQFFRGLLRDRILQASALVFTLGLAIRLVEHAQPLGFAGRVTAFVEPVLLATVLVALLWGRSRRASRREKQFWDLLALGWACWLVVQLLLLLDLSLPWVSASFITDALHILYYLLLALAIDLRPHVAPAHSLTTLRRRLESVTGLVAFFGVLVYVGLVIEPKPLDFSLSFVDREQGVVPFLLLRISLDIFILTRLLYAGFTSRGRWPALYFLLAAALLFDAVALVPALLHITWHGPVLELLLCAPGFLVVAAARLRFAPVAAEAEAHPEPLAPKDMPEMSRTSLVAVYALVVPLAHLLAFPLGLLEAASRTARDVLALIYLIVVGSLAAVHQFLLDKERRQAVESLRHEIDERERTNRQLALRQAQTEQFNYTISHELQAPLVTIGGFVGLLESDLKRHDELQMSRDLEKIRHATDHMGQVMRELLDLSRVGWRVEPTEDLSLLSVVEAARERLEAKNEPREPHIVLETGLPAVRADEARMVDVMTNLIDNAVKFTPLDRRPEIRIGCRDDDPPVFYVADNGRGIQSHFRDKIFGLFDRLDPTIEGTGVGLALVKRIIEEHGGRVWVESAGVGQGATFCFTLGRPEQRPPSTPATRRRG